MSKLRNRLENMIFPDCGHSDKAPHPGFSPCGTVWAALTLSSPFKIVFPSLELLSLY